MLAGYSPVATFHQPATRDGSLRQTRGPGLHHGDAHRGLPRQPSPSPARYAPGVARVHRHGADMSARGGVVGPYRLQTPLTSAFPRKAGRTRFRRTSAARPRHAAGKTAHRRASSWLDARLDPRVPVATIFVRAHDFSTRGVANQLRCDHLMNLRLASTWGFGLARGDAPSALIDTRFSESPMRTEAPDRT